MKRPLPESAAILHKRLVRLDELAANADEASKLHDLRSELADAAGLLDGPLETQALLIENGIAVDTPPALVEARKRASTVLDRFRANTKAATLTRAQTWKNLLADIDTACEELSVEMNSAWRGYRNAAYSGDSPTAVKARGLARTTQNDAALKEYSALFEQFSKLFEDLPEDRGAIERVGLLAVRLQEVGKKFDFEVPDDVKQFLEAVLSVDGAPLGLLTTGVHK